jgi:putative membrane protein
MKTPIIFLKGMLMGICDVIPGVSGGTIAFITGIYSRLINAVKGFSPAILADAWAFLRKKDKAPLKEDIKNLDLIFLITLLLGVATAIYIGSGILTYLLQNYFVYTISFFVGLILASAQVIYKNIEKHHSKNIIVGVIGLLAGLLLSVLIPVKVNPTLLYVFMGGFLAISAMFLPGISGAFILFILGIYEFMLNVLHNIKDNLLFLISFLLGAALGAFGISRLISYLFKKDRCKTLYFLLGLVLGSLSIPIKKIFQSDFSWTLPTTSAALILFILGFIIVVIINKLK